MQSKFSQSDAEQYLETYAAYGADLALRVYTTRLLGRDSRLVLHGGGNTSVKTTMKDELGRDVSVLCVKGSGWDMGDIEPAGLPAVMLEPLRDLRQLDALSDEDMVNAARRNLMDCKAPNPSVETLLHAFLPHKYIDHTHADAVLAIVNQPNAVELTQKIWGKRMGIVPYIMPGFQLALKALEVYEQDPSVEGLILINHGIFTFADDAEMAYERMIRAVSEAEDFLKETAQKAVPDLELRPLPSHEAVTHFLPILRGQLINHVESPGSVILHSRNSTQIESFLEHPELESIALRGTITPDHVIRTKQKPLILDLERDSSAFEKQVALALDTYVKEYKTYFATQRDSKGVVRKQVHPLPIVFLIKGYGLVTMGSNFKAASIAADLYEHTIDTILRAESIGTYTPLSDDHVFDMEYWSLEQAKLGKKKPAPLEGRVTVVTGAAGGIGAAAAARFAAAGSNLLLTDRMAVPLDKLAESISKASGVKVVTCVADVTDEDGMNRVVARAVESFGGLDFIISNAGTAPSGSMHESNALLRQSLEINLLSHQYISAAAVSVMLAQRVGGCLLYNASKSAFNPGPGFGPYSVAKAGVIALMKQYGVEYAAHGIRSGAVNADRIRTGLFDEALISARAKARGLEPDAYFRANLLDREVLAEDVAEAFYHLAVAEKTTACTLTVDGGNIAASPR